MLPTQIFRSILLVMCGVFLGGFVMFSFLGPPVPCPVCKCRSSPQQQQTKFDLLLEKKLENGKESIMNDSNDVKNVIVQQKSTEAAAAAAAATEEAMCAVKNDDDDDDSAAEPEQAFLSINSNEAWWKQSVVASRTALEPSSYLCGALDVDPIEMRATGQNGETRPWCRPSDLKAFISGTLAEPKKSIIDEMKPAGFMFANEGAMHATHHFESMARYYCGLMPHNTLPWSITFRTYQQWITNNYQNSDVIPRNNDNNNNNAKLLPPPKAPPPRRAARYTANDIAIGVYTADRFLWSRATATLLTFLGRHPQERVFFFSDKPDPLVSLTDCVE